MHGVRHEFLPGAGLASDHHRRIRLTQAANNPENLLHGRSLPCRSCPLPSLSPAGQEYLACELIGEDGNVVAAHACNLVETGKEAHRLALIVQDYTETAHEEIP